MATEKERKFLPNGTPMDLTHWDHEKIEQGYLVLHKGQQVRVRKSIVVRPDGRENVSFTLAYKEDVENYNHVTVNIRTEIEVAINPLKGQELLDTCKYKLKKERWSSHFIDDVGPGPWHNAATCEVAIDMYPDGMKVIEVEYLTDNVEWVHPYCGKEVTGIKKYSNVQIAKENEESISD